MADREGEGVVRGGKSRVSGAKRVRMQIPSDTEGEEPGVPATQPPATLPVPPPPSAARPPRLRRLAGGLRPPIAGGGGGAAARGLPRFASRGRRLPFYGDPPASIKRWMDLEAAEGSASEGEDTDTSGTSGTSSSGEAHAGSEQESDGSGEESAESGEESDGSASSSKDEATQRQGSPSSSSSDSSYVDEEGNLRTEAMEKIRELARRVRVAP